MTLEQAQAKAAAGEERVKSLETQKNLQREPMIRKVFW